MYDLLKVQKSRLVQRKVECATSTAFFDRYIPCCPLVSKSPIRRTGFYKSHPLIYPFGTQLTVFNESSTLNLPLLTCVLGLLTHLISVAVDLHCGRMILIEILRLSSRVTGKLERYNSVVVGYAG